MGAEISTKSGCRQHIFKKIRKNWELVKAEGEENATRVQGPECGSAQHAARIQPPRYHRSVPGRKGRARGLLLQNSTEHMRISNRWADSIVRELKKEEDKLQLKIGGLCGCCKYALSFGAMRLSAEDQMWNLKPQFTGFYCLSGSQPHQISNGTVNALVRKVWAPQSWGGDTWKELGPHPSCICLDSGAAPMSLAGRPWNAHICGDQSYKGSWFTIPNYPLSDPKSQGVKNYNILLFF